MCHLFCTLFGTPANSLSVEACMRGRIRTTISSDVNCEVQTAYCEFCSKLNGKAVDLQLKSILTVFYLVNDKRTPMQY